MVSRHYARVGSTTDDRHVLLNTFKRMDILTFARTVCRQHVLMMRSIITLFSVVLNLSQNSLSGYSNHDWHGSCFQYMRYGKILVI